MKKLLFMMAISIINDTVSHEKWLSNLSHEDFL